MQKPNSYDEVKAGGEFVPVELGGHYCVIKQVTETKSSNGKDMIVVLFDFCSPDSQKDYFMESFKNDIRPDKKWPFNGTKYIMVNDYQDQTKVSRNFKSFCNCVEQSNPGFTIQWGDDWGKQFTGKQIGAVYGEVENEYNGERKMRREVRWFCSISRVSSAAVPEAKLIPVSAPAFTPVVDAESEELPF